MSSNSAQEGRLLNDVPPAFPSSQVSESEVKAKGKLPLQSWAFHAMASWPLLFCVSSFFVFSCMSSSFASPYEWASLLMVSYTIFVLFCSSQSPLATREENLEEIMSAIDTLREKEARQRLAELLAFVRNIRVVLVAGHSLAVKDHFVRCRLEQEQK